MARYVGPVCRLCRRAGMKLFLKGERCLTPRCAVERRHRPPGVHLPRRRRVSDYGLQLREKQKAKQVYGIFERQFRRYFQEALRRPGITGQYLLQLLEMRLDNVVFRLGFADSRAQARQFVNHGHMQVNGRRVDISSYRVRPGETISWSDRSHNREVFKIRVVEVSKRLVPQWLSVDAAEMTGEIMSWPDPSDIDASFDTRLIVEYYSR